MVEPDHMWFLETRNGNFDFSRLLKQVFEFNINTRTRLILLDYNQMTLRALLLSAEFFVLLSQAL